MNNKFTLSRFQNVNYVKENLENLIENNLVLSRYKDDDPDKEIAHRNFKDCYEFIMNNEETENDYRCLLKIHEILMNGLNDDIKSELNETQINELHDMINQPAKANLEIAIDVMLYILDKRLFVDGDVRAALLFANKIMIDNGCGIITIASNHTDTFRAKLKQYKDNNDYDIKDWIYMYCIKGPKLEY